MTKDQTRTTRSGPLRSGDLQVSLPDPAPRDFPTKVLYFHVCAKILAAPLCRFSAKGPNALTHKVPHMLKHSFAILLSLTTLVLAACSTPVATMDGAVTDTGVAPADGAVVQDAPSAAVDAPNPGVDGTAGGRMCGMMSCAAGEVCCAATGPNNPMRCAAANACPTQIVCEGPEHCAAGTSCCTDGIQSLCTDNARCTERSCRTAVDCTGAQMCCPFGQGRVCRPNC